MSASYDWDLLQSLHAVLEAGSFSAAAKLRRLTQPTLGRHIDQLERQLGAPLFLRSPRGLQPTDLALTFRPHLTDMAAAAGAAGRDAAESATGQGVVRVTVSDIMGGEILPEILTRFREAHPAIDVELAVSNRLEDLSRRDADIAVRMSRPTQNSLVARKAGDLTLGFYATAGYLARKGTPSDFEALQDHTLIGYDSFLPDVARNLSIGRPITRDLFGLRTDSDLTQLAALRAGYGIGACQRQIGRRSGLVPVMHDIFTFQLELWICMHETLRGSPRMRLMFDHLVAELTAYVAEDR
jgi:DNA-binding transcriptional LysR family regulator